MGLMGFPLNTANYQSKLHNIPKRKDIKICGKGKSKAIPLQAWGGPEASRKLRFLDFMTTAQDGGKVVSLMHRLHLPPGNVPGTHLC